MGAMDQMTLFSDSERQQSIVNVASVPQRSPFRYPGGKTWLIPIVRIWLQSQPQKPSALVEPFAGGAIVSLTAAFEELAERVTMVEFDQNVAAVWKAILSDDCASLAERIRDFDLTIENVRAELDRNQVSMVERAFQTILRNRVNHGGIMAPGSGLIKHGENGRGIKSRWYAQTLSRRILNIATVRDRLSFLQGDGLEVLRNTLAEAKNVYFIDPPYTASGKKAGKRLYTHNELDHKELFRITSELRGDFLMTYDDAEGVRTLARDFGFDTRLVSMKNTHHAKMRELLIGRDLDWLGKSGLNTASISQM